MGYRELLDTLRRQMEEERGRILAEADRRSRLIADEAQRESGSLRDRFANEEFHEDNMAREKIITQARQEVAVKVLTARRAAMDAVREGLVAELGKLRAGAGYRAVLERLADEILAASPGISRWQVDQRDIPALKQILASRKAVNPAFESLEKGSLGGVSATTADGTLAIHNTFDARMARIWQGLEVEVAAVLAPPGK